MTRILSLVLVGVVALLLFLVPEVSAPHFAALDANELLALTPGPSGAGEPAGNPTIADLALESAVQQGSTRRLRLSDVSLQDTPQDVRGEAASAASPGSAALDRIARRSVVRALRERAAEQLDSEGQPLPELTIEGESEAVEGGLTFAVFEADGRTGISLWPAGQTQPWRAERDWTPPRRTALIPPLAAIVLAILFRRPVLALFAGVLAAGWLRRTAEGTGMLDALSAAAAYVPDSLSAPAPLRGPAWWARLQPHLPDWLTRDLWPQLLDPDRSMIIGFVVLLLAMVGVITRSGGIRGLMDAIAGIARSARSTLIATWIMGLIIFFDDYANTILVGSTMRPLSDRFRVAREKLAYIVDSTAAPVAGLSIFSTWIAFEVSTYSAQLPAAGLATTDGYSVFLQSLPFRFYSILTLCFVGLVVILNRDFGPMLHAERRARHTGELVRKGGKPMVTAQGTDLEPAPGVEPHAAAAIYPIATFLGLTLFYIFLTGGVFSTPWLEVVREKQFVETAIAAIGNGSSTLALVIGSAAGLWVAMAIGHAKGMRAFADILRAAFTTLRALGVAIVILYLAWMIGAACDELRTATYLTGLLGDRVLPALLPALLFLMAAAVAFSTGSSWSTMSILLPLVVGLAFTLGETIDLGGMGLLVMTIGAVLEGAIFGDHCSPISDTTVLSSTASASDHIDHVRTQAPYAILTMAVALAVGYLPCAFFPAWKPLYALGLGLVVLAAALLIFGRSAESEGPPGFEEPEPDTQFA